MGPSQRLAAGVVAQVVCGAVEHARNRVLVNAEELEMSQVARSARELVEALGAGVDEIEVQGSLSGMPMITLGPGVRLRGGTLSFGGKGVRLTRDNELDGVTVLTEDDEVAILNDTSVADLGTLTLRGVRTTGQVLLLAADAVRAGHVLVDGLQIDRADVRGCVDRPRGFGVEALQGAFTLWNRQPDPAVVLTAELLDIAVGSAATPVRGSGVFVGGHGDWEGSSDGGTIRVSLLRTGEIHTNGGIPDRHPRRDQWWRVRDLRGGGAGGRQRGAGDDQRPERHGPRQLGRGGEVDRDRAGHVQRPERDRLRELRRDRSSRRPGPDPDVRQWSARLQPLRRQPPPRLVRNDRHARRRVGRGAGLKAPPDPRDLR
jgi:hypothetical protein